MRLWHSHIKKGLIYAIGSAANSAALFLLVPYLVNALPPEEYGAWALFEVAILLLYQLILVGLDVALMRDYWFLADQAKRAQLVGTIFLGVAVWGAAVVGGGVGLLAAGLHLSLPGGQYVIILTLMVAWTEALFTVLQTMVRIQEKAAVYVTLSIGRMILFMVVAIALVHIGYGINGALAGRLLATVAGLGVAAVLGARSISLCPDWAALRRAIRFGLPMLPTSLASYILLASDRYVLQKFSTLESVAIYSFAYKIAATLDVFVTRPFALDWAPRRFKIAGAADAPRKYAQILVMYSFAAIAFALFVVAFTPEIYARLAPPVYKTGIAAVPIILIAYLIFGVSHPLNIGVMLKGRTEYLPALSWLAAGICLALNWWWIPQYGLWGAAWATVLAYAIWTTGITWTSQRLYEVRYSWRQLAVVMAAGIAGYGGLWTIEQVTSVDTGIPVLAAKIIWIMLVLTLCGYKLWRSDATVET
jgi:O-antigen/teichoic acid export membrane protein